MKLESIDKDERIRKLQNEIIHDNPNSWSLLEIAAQLVRLNDTLDAIRWQGVQQADRLGRDEEDQNVELYKPLIYGAS